MAKKLTKAQIEALKLAADNRLVWIFMSGAWRDKDNYKAVREATISKLSREGLIKSEYYAGHSERIEYVMRLTDKGRAILDG